MISTVSVQFDGTIVVDLLFKVIILCNVSGVTLVFPILYGKITNKLDPEMKKNFYFFGVGIGVLLMGIWLIISFIFIYSPLFMLLGILCISPSGFLIFRGVVHPKIKTSNHE